MQCSRCDSEGRCIRLAVDSVLVEGVDGEAAEEFGVEVGGFLRHDFAGEGDIFELVEGDGLDEEGDVGFAGFDEGDGFAGFAEVLDVAGGGDLVLVRPRSWSRTTVWSWATPSWRWLGGRFLSSGAMASGLGVRR